MQPEASALGIKRYSANHRQPLSDIGRQMDSQLKEYRSTLQDDPKKCPDLVECTCNMITPKCV